MSLRDRFFTPSTARAILSWRLLVGVGVGAGLGFAGAGWATAIAGGVVTYGALVLIAMWSAQPDRTTSAAIDPFAVGEPWRQLVQRAQSSARKLRATVSTAPNGPLRQRLDSITDDVDRGLDEAWSVARHGNAIDAAVRRLDPTALRSRLATLQRQNSDTPTSDLSEAIASVEGQLATADRLKAQSEETERSLRLTQTKLDELVAHASEVVVGTLPPDIYAGEVDELVVALEALNQAAREVDTGSHPVSDLAAENGPENGTAGGRA